MDVYTIYSVDDINFIADYQLEKIEILIEIIKKYNIQTYMSVYFVWCTELYLQYICFKNPTISATLYFQTKLDSLEIDTQNIDYLLTLLNSRQCISGHITMLKLYIYYIYRFNITVYPEIHCLEFNKVNRSRIASSRILIN